MDKRLVDTDITIDDLKSALKSMPNNKTPGCDGLPAEFYKVFWNKIKDLLYEAVMYAYRKGEMHISARRGIITLIPKKDKDVNYIKNWRPLTLLNTDYKIVAKTLSQRLKVKLLKIVNTDQTGFLKGRFIGENIRLILDTMEYAGAENIPALLISIDYEKCFDRLEWSAVIGALRYFNFGDKFIRWIELLYKNVESCTTNNGKSSEWFKPTRGLRQGCPLSPYLFVVTAEIFANLIRKNPNIQGIKIKETEIKLMQYADDTNIFSLFDANSLNNIIETFDFIQRNTGLKVNYDKTNIYRIGSLKHSDATLYTQKHFKWVNTPITVLRVNITHDKHILIKSNYDAVFKKNDDMTKLWKNRNLSLAGKVITINTLMSSQLIYKLSCMESPTEEHYKKYKLTTRNYPWDGKNAKIAYNTLTCSIEHGGFKLVDLKKKDAALKIQWVKRITKNKKVAQLAYYFLPGLGEILWECNLHHRHVEGFMPKNNFWYDVLVSWCKFNFIEQEDINSIMNSVIWLNSEITVKDKPIMSKNV